MRLTHVPAAYLHLRVSPDGSRIAFSSDGTGDRDVYVVNADGTGLVDVTRHPADDRHAVWIP